jgi:hypothetical protein
MPVTHSPPDFAVEQTEPSESGRGWSDRAPRDSKHNGLVEAPEKAGGPKRLRKLLDVLHLFARSARKKLIHNDIQSVRGPSATKPATSYRSPAA